jgi:GTP cyclohydrolase FolE2
MYRTDDPSTFALAGQPAPDARAGANGVHNHAARPVYAMLKCEDERHLTMHAHDNPLFVGDMARNAALRLKADTRVTWFHVRAENQ